MFQKELLQGEPKEKVYSLTIKQTGIPQYFTVKFSPSGRTFTNVILPVTYSKDAIEGQTQVECSVPNIRSFYDYSISGKGVSVVSFERGEPTASFALSSSGVNATISLDVGIGSG